MRIITFTGWGQQADALAPLITEGAEAQHIHYQNFEGYRELLPFLKGKECDVVLGWSLGGQIALKAISEGLLKPRLLVLLATPFEFLASALNPFGMDVSSFNSFEQDFYKNPEKTQRKFTLLMNRHDSKAADQNKTALAALPSPEGWLAWLRELKYFSCTDLRFTAPQKTLIIQGIQDNVVNIEQAYLLKNHIPNSNVTVLEDAGHMPHLHAPLMIHHLIQHECENLQELA